MLSDAVGSKIYQYCSQHSSGVDVVGCRHMSQSDLLNY